MAIWDLDFAYVCCGWGFRNTDMAYIRVERDKALEIAILEDCEDFVQACLHGIKPNVKNVKNKKLVEKTLERIYGLPDPTLPPVKLSPGLLSSIEAIVEYDRKIVETKSKTEAIDKEVKELEKARDLAMIPILDEMKTATKGIFKTSGRQFTVEYGPTGRSSVKTEILKEKYPDVYKEVYLPSTKRTLKVQTTAIV